VKIDGVEVHVEGDGAETIVMVHGWPDTYRLWDAQVAALKSRYRCVRFTLPGFDGQPARRTYTVDEISEFFRHVIEQVAPGKKVILMLHDWGCIFGYQFYVRQPQLVSRIVGVDIGDPVSMRRAATPGVMFAVLTYQLILAVAWMLGGKAGDAITRWMAARLRCPSDPRLISSAMTYPYYMTWFGGAQGYQRHFREFRPECPMLYLYAKRKPFMFHAPSWLSFIEQRPGNKVVGFDTGHWIMSVEPQRFNQVVGEWL
jgi:pimeloyl-ACP methyl ester carboxylesterase